MGLFNHLFGGKRGLAKELAADSNKRMALWDAHVKNYADRHDLAKSFNFGRVDMAMEDWPVLMKVLDQIASSISTELVTVEAEEAVDSEILDDLRRFASMESADETRALQAMISEEFNKEKPLLELLKKTHEMLKVELHAIRMIRQKPGNVRDLLLGLFRIINNNEYEAMAMFQKENYGSRAKYEQVNGLTRAIILEEEIKSEIESDESKFVRAMLKATEDPESTSQYHKLAEKIYDELVSLAQDHGLSRDPLENLKLLERFIGNDEVMLKIVRKLRPKYSASKTGWVVQAFRKAFELGHFIDYEERLD